MPDLTPNEQKDIIKQALKEWLNEQFAAFGKWTITGLFAAAFCGLVAVWLMGQGWHK